MPFSTCCGAETKNTEQDICPHCRYYCDWTDEYEEPTQEEKQLEIEAEYQIEEEQINKHQNK
tara:strand:- start:2 stop:187 length:186 start_codon:yes stop_codon:yes gene_type:complete